MKQSEALRKKAEEEDNDLIALGIFTKVIREERAERFEGYKLKITEAGYTLKEFPDQGKVTIQTDKFGTLSFYPKANKLLIHKGQMWKKPGLRWIINNLLK